MSLAEKLLTSPMLLLTKFDGIYLESGLFTCFNTTVGQDMHSVYFMSLIVHILSWKIIALASSLDGFEVPNHV